MNHYMGSGAFPEKSTFCMPATNAGSSSVMKRRNKAHYDHLLGIELVLLVLPKEL